MALSPAQQKWLEDMKRQEQEAEENRLAYLASRTSSEVARDEETRSIQIETAERRHCEVPVKEQPLTEAQKNIVARRYSEEG